ncbi:MAG: HNH endonuclease signature motif containing protein [Chloroflexota bacterium]
MGNTFELEELPGVRIGWYGRPSTKVWRKLRQVIFARDEGRCRYCHDRVELHQCHIHHVLELSQGGTNHPTNLKTLCVSCHRLRHPHMLTKAAALGQKKEENATEKIESG